MALTEIFYARFKEQPNLGLSLTPWQFRISFLLEGFTGTATELEVYAAVPLKLSKADSDSSIFSPINSTKAVINLRATNEAQARTFALLDDRQMHIKVMADESGGENYTTPVFFGWSIPTDLSYDYKKPPFPLSVTAVCGLATLKERPVVDATGKRFQGFVPISTVLRTCFSKTGLVLPTQVADNLYESSDLATGQLVGGKANPIKDPNYQTHVRAETLVNDKYETVFSYDTIRLFQEPKALRAAQINGKWMVVRVPEMAGGWDTQGNELTLQARTYNSGNLTAAPDSHNSINLNTYADFTGPLQVLNRSPKQGLQSSRPGVRIEQSFGRILSKLPNGDFSQVDGTGLPTGWLTNNLSTGNRFRVGTGTLADPYRLRLNGAGDEKINNDTPCVLSTVTYSTVSKEYTTFQKRTLKGRAQLVNARAAKVFVRVLRDDPYPYIYTATGLLYEGKIKEKERVATLYYNTRKNTQNRDETKPGWFDWSLDLGEIDRVRQITVYLCTPEALDDYDGNGNVIGPELGPPTPYVEYADVRLETAQVGLVLDGRQETRVKPGQVVKDTTLTISLGDIPDAAYPYDRTGAFFSTQSGNTFTSSGRWFRPDADILAANPTGKDVPKSVLAWLTDAHAKQAMYPANTFEGTLIGRLPYGMFSVLHVTDILDSLGNTVPHILTRWEWDVRMCQHTVTAQELEPGRTATLPAARKQWQTPDGLLDINPGEDGAPLEPAQDAGLSPLQRIKRDLSLIGFDPPIGRPSGALPLGMAPFAGSGPVFSATASVGGKKLATVLSFALKLEKLKLIRG